MTLRIAVTRAMPDAEATAARLKARGAVPVVAPLLTIAPCAFDTSLRSVQALAFTSANGVRAFPMSREATSIPVFAVGDATAKAARAAGFEDVRSADGDVTSLASVIAASLDASAGAVVHISGADVSGDLAGALRSFGFRAERRVAYTAVAVTELPQQLREPLDMVLFHSARAAETFLALGAGESPRLVAVCLSERVAEVARKGVWKRVVVAPAPREDALIEAT